MCDYAVEEEAAGETDRCPYLAQNAILYLVSASYNENNYAVRGGSEAIWLHLFSKAGLVLIPAHCRAQAERWDSCALAKGMILQ